MASFTNEMQRRFLLLQIGHAGVCDGWQWLVKTMLETIDGYYLENSTVSKICITEIKNKFSLMRVCTGGPAADPVVRDILITFENVSRLVCVNCCSIHAGGTAGDHQWAATVCKECIKSNWRWKDLEWKPFSELFDFGPLQRIMDLIKPSVYKDRLAEAIYWANGV